MIKEEDRLAAVLAEIDHDVRIVPRGSYVRTPTGQVYENRSFEGKTFKLSEPILRAKKFTRSKKQFACQSRF